MAAQCSHAAVEAVLRSDKNKVKEWRSEGMMKIVVGVTNEKEMLKYNQLAKELELVTAVITDAGKTIVAPGTRTCFAIGPDEEDKIDEVTGKLKII